MRAILVSNGNKIDDDLIYYRYARTLADHGVNVTVIGMPSNTDGMDPRIKTIIIKEAKNRFDRFVFSLKRIKKLCRSLASPDTMFFFFTVDLGKVAKTVKMRGAKYTFVYLENYYEKIMYKEWIPRLLRKKVRDHMYKWQIEVSNNAAASVFVDRVTLEKFSSGIFTKKLLIPNFPIGEGTRVPDHDFNHRPLKMIYVGGITEDRGAYIMMQMGEELRDIAEIHLYGPVNDEELERKIKSCTNVFYHGVTSYVKILEYLYDYDIGLFLIPLGGMYDYSAENVTKVFEYMRAGLPIMSTDIKGLRQIIVYDSHAGICLKTDNVDALIKQVRSFIESTRAEKLKEMSENGYKAYLDRYNWDSVKHRVYEAMQLGDN